jgi:integrase
MRDAVKKLLYYRANGLDYRTEDKRLRTWIETADPILREKLAQHGFIKIPKRITTKELWDVFLEQKNNVVESTLDIYDDVQDRFFSYFKGNELITDLTDERITAWKHALLGRYSEATVAGTLKNTAVVFNWAKKLKYLDESPLKGVPKGSYVNKGNNRHITMDEYYRLLDVAICQEWRVIFALARIGGLRAPSEVLGVRWADVDWENNRFSFVDSKRKEKNGDPVHRTVPLFPALRVELETLWERDREMNREFVINRYRDPKTNLGTRFTVAARAAGLGKIPRPFDNMRASRSTEIERKFGPKVESEWIGHTPEVARKHYLMVREDDFADAANWDS